MLRFQHNKREAANIKYISALPVIFGVKYFADALWKVANERAIEVQLKYRLIEVLPKENLAVFESIDEPHQQMVQQVIFRKELVVKSDYKLYYVLQI